MEKYGFVYIWFDRKYKRYYIGCHWGYENDGYVCSSPWMRQAYKHRPHDFKRRILKKVNQRNELFKEEEKWLSLIKEEELKIRYYNLNKWAGSHWTLNENHLTTRQKLSISMKQKIESDPEFRASLGKKGMNWYTSGETDKRFYDNEVLEGFTRGRSHTQEAWNKGIPRTEEQNKQHSEKLKKKYANGDISPPNKGKGGIEKICENCGKEFRISTSRAKIEGYGKYCCMKCRSEGRSTTIKCIECGKEKRLPISNAKQGGKFCSHTCSTKHLMKNSLSKYLSDKRWKNKYEKENY